MRLCISRITIFYSIKPINKRIQRQSHAISHVLNFKLFPRIFLLHWGLRICSNKYSVWANWRVKNWRDEKYSNKDFPLIRYENVYLLLLVNSNFDLLNFQGLIWMFFGKLAFFWNVGNYFWKIGNYFSSIVFNWPLNQIPLVRVCMIFS